MIYGIQPGTASSDDSKGSPVGAVAGFKALGEETRFRILQLVAEGEMYAQEIGQNFPHLGQPAISRHLRYLAAEGILDVRDAQAKKYYSLNRGRIQALESTLRRLAASASGSVGPAREEDPE